MLKCTSFSHRQSNHLYEPSGLFSFFWRLRRGEEEVSAHLLTPAFIAKREPAKKVIPCETTKRITTLKESGGRFLPPMAAILPIRFISLEEFFN